MTKGPKDTPRALFAALDIETSPEARAARLVGGGRAVDLSAAALHEISAAAWIVMEEQPAGEWLVKGPVAFGDPVEEFDILLALDEFLRELREQGGELCTYNGHRHDLPTIRRRAMRSWMFEMDGLFPAEPVKHRDLMPHSGGKNGSPKLREACAALAVSCDPSPTKESVVSARIIKAEVDATATMLLRLFDLATERRDPTVLARSWFALSEHIRRTRSNGDHLWQFTESPELAAALDP